MIAYQQANHKWKFLFLGPQSARWYARQIGIPQDHVFAFNADASGINELMQRLGSSVAAYRLGDPNFILRLQDKETQA